MFFLGFMIGAALGVFFAFFYKIERSYYKEEKHGPVLKQGPRIIKRKQVHKVRVHDDFSMWQKENES